MRDDPQPSVNSDFTVTHWSQIQAAQTSSPQDRQAVLDMLARRYWKPIYQYLKAKGHQDAEAWDITQDFFVEVILKRDLFGQADRHRGRFRAFLLHSLKNFVRDRHRRESVKRRTPDRPMVSIDQWASVDRSRLDPPAPDVPPDTLYHRAWAASLLEQVVEKLADECRESGLEAHFEIFRERFIRPSLEQVEPAPLDTLAERYGLTSKQAANRGETIRRRFRKLLLEEVRRTVIDESAAEDEIRSLMTHLQK